jgi:hypothetical protein
LQFTLSIEGLTLNNKNLAIVLILTIAFSSLSLLTVKPATAQSIAKPSVPSFTVTFISSSFLVAGTATTNPYTGQNQTTSSYRVWNNTIQLTIQNQPEYSDGKNNLYYNIQMKGHFEENWTEIYRGIIYPLQSNSNSTTVISYKQNGMGQFNMGNQEISLPEGSQLDFQVQAQIGFFTATPYGIVGHPIPLGATEVFTSKASSGWSNTQTITIGEISTSPTPTPAVPEFPSWTILLLLTLMVSTSLAYFKKHKR